MEGTFLGIFQRLEKLLEKAENDWHQQKNPVGSLVRVISLDTLEEPGAVVLEFKKHLAVLLVSEAGKR